MEAYDSHDKVKKHEQVIMEKRRHLMDLLDKKTGAGKADREHTSGAGDCLWELGEGGAENTGKGGGEQGTNSKQDLRKWKDDAMSMLRKGKN